MRVIVTGGCGKAGRHVIKVLADAGHDVTNLDRVSPPGNLAEELPGRMIRLELTDAGEVYDAFAQVKPEGVCHLAAIPSPRGWARQHTFANNVLSTYNVMQAAGETGCRRFVYASSEMATGWLTTEELPARFPFKEEDRVDSANAYALSKYLGEIIADSMVVRYPDMAICSMRINNVVPPEDYAKLQYRRDNFPEGGNNFWSYIDARDVAGAFRAALEGKSEGHEVYLIAAADTCLDTPIREAVKKRYGTEGNFADGHGEYDSAFDCSKINNHFGWQPRYSWRNQPK